MWFVVSKWESSPNRGKQKKIPCNWRLKALWKNPKDAKPIWQTMDNFWARDVSLSKLAILAIHDANLQTQVGNLERNFSTKNSFLRNLRLLTHGNDGLLPGYFLSKIVTVQIGTSQSWGPKSLKPTSLQQAKWRWPDPQVGSDLFWIDPYPLCKVCSDRKIASECVCDLVWCVDASTMCVYEKESKECGKGEENLLSQTWTACAAANFLKSTPCHSVGFQETSQSPAFHG